MNVCMCFDNDNPEYCCECMYVFDNDNPEYCCECMYVFDNDSHNPEYCCVCMCLTMTILSTVVYVCV